MFIKILKMKKLLLILILASFNLSFAQMLPKDFKISNDVYKKFKSDVKQNKGNNLIGRFSSSPVSSQTIISNFISDIIVVSNDGGDTVWFGTGKGIPRHESVFRADLFVGIGDQISDGDLVR